MRLLVMGGTRFMGRATVERAVAAGHDVTVLHRGTRPPPAAGRVHEVRGDRGDAATLEQLRRERFGAVIDLSAYTAPQTVALVSALPDVPRFVHVSSGAVYAPRPTYPWPEDAPEGPWELWGAYGAEKLACEHVLRSARGRLTTVAVRLPYVLGPENYIAREEFVLNRLLDGEPVVVPGDGEALVQFIAAQDVAALLVALAERHGAPGFQVLNAGGHELVSLRGFVELCADVAGRPPLIRSAAGTPDAPFDARSAPFPFPNVPFVLDVDRLRRLDLPVPRLTVRDVLSTSLEALLAAPERRAWTRTAGELAALDGNRRDTRSPSDREAHRPPDASVRVSGAAMGT